MPVVLNKRNYNGHIPPGSIFIGRPSKYGNPFMMGRDGDRDDVVNKHMFWLVEGKGRRLLKDIQRDLGGHDLVCFCAPLACHGNFLLSLANDPDLLDFVTAYPSVKAMVKWIDAGRPRWQPDSEGN